MWNWKSIKQAPHSEQATGHGMHYRQIVFTQRCSPRAREFLRSVNFSSPRRVAEFSDCGLFSLYETPKTYFPVTSLQPRESQNDSDFLCGRWRFKGVPSGTGDILRLLVGELGTPKLAQIFSYGKWLYPYIMPLHGASDLDQRCLKTRNSEDECTFPPNI